MSIYVMPETEEETLQINPPADALIMRVTITPVESDENSEPSTTEDLK